jgi:hypothetical protein
MLHRERLRCTKNTKCTAEMQLKQQQTPRCHPERSERSLKRSPRHNFVSLLYQFSRGHSPSIATRDDSTRKKTGRKNKFSSRVEVRVVVPKHSEPLIKRGALVPLFLR